MDIARLLAELRRELVNVEAAIASLECLRASRAAGERSRDVGQDSTSPAAGVHAGQPIR